MISHVDFSAVSVAMEISVAEKANPYAFVRLRKLVVVEDVRATLYTEVSVSRESNGWRILSSAENVLEKLQATRGSLFLNFYCELVDDSLQDFVLHSIVLVEFRRLDDSILVGEQLH